MRPRRKLLRNLLLLTCLTVVACVSWYHFRTIFVHEAIQQLEELPIGDVVHLAGVVTAVDPAEKRFWVQDDTGTVLINAGPDKVQPHQYVTIRAKKTARYNPAIGPSSVNLAEVKVQLIHNHASLPEPVPLVLPAFPRREKSGTRVRLTAVVRSVTLDKIYGARIIAGQSGHEVQIVLVSTTSKITPPVDSTVSVVGVPEEVVEASGQVRRIWVNSSNDIQFLQAAPKHPQLFSIRDIYRDPAARSGHLVRVRGVVVAEPDSNHILIEDRWGQIECELSSSYAVPIGSLVDATGFPNIDGLRISLSQTLTTPLSEQDSSSIDSQGSDDKVLTTVAAVRGLSPSVAAQALPVHVSGVITYNDPRRQQLFIQDASGGIYVKYSASPPGLQSGDRVTLNGITNAGDFAPVIIAPKFRVQGRSQLPRPVSVSPAEAAAGQLDSHFVRVEGVVHLIKVGEESRKSEITFELHSTIGQVHVYASPLFSSPDQLRGIEDARVSLQGVFATVFNSRRQLVGYQLLVPNPGDIRVIEPAISNPFELPATPIGALLQFSQQGRSGHRLKVQGRVTMVSRDFLYLQDETGGVEVRGDTTSFTPGQSLAALGYASLVGRYSPIITDGSFRSIDSNGTTHPQPATPEAILQGQYDSQLVSIEGKLVAVMKAPSGRVLLLQSGAHNFTAELPQDDVAVDSLPEEGSVLRLAGVCSTQVDPEKLYLLLSQQPATFKILLRFPSDIVVIRRAPFWTPKRAGLVLVLALGVIIAAIVWVSALRRRIGIQKLALRKAGETRQAISDLSNAMSEVSREQRFDSQVSVRGTEEIAHLVMGFNGMLSELHRAQHARKEAESLLKQQALTDALTTLPNRRLLSDRLTQSVAAARRDGSQIAVLYIDLDSFKLVNDSLGHKAGDFLLVDVADRLSSRIRRSDTLARLGGDEFTVILNRIAKVDDARTVANSILDVLSRPFQIEGQEITIGASIGISIFPEHADNENDLLQHADSAMYAAKRSGKNRVMVYTNDLGETVRERLTLENQLRRAIASGDIKLHYQPEFDLVSGRLVRFEALARWTHPTLGTIPPSKFIPVAEESGLVIPLGAYILEKACTEALRWQSLPGAPIQVAVNVSSIQFSANSFVDDVLAILNKTGLSPTLLQIELTESAMLTGVEVARESIQRLKSHGISVAIDDFGTGYSCLSYLPQLAFDALKIDRSFVRDMMQRPETKAMVRCLVILAQELGMKVIVEGIETREQLQLVEVMGGNEAQGYLLGRPTPNPISEVMSLVTNAADNRLVDSKVGD